MKHTLLCASLLIALGGCSSSSNPDAVYLTDLWKSDENHEEQEAQSNEAKNEQSDNPIIDRLAPSESAAQAMAQVNENIELSEDEAIAPMPASDELVQSEEQNVQVDAPQVQSTQVQPAQTLPVQAAAPSAEIAPAANNAVSPLLLNVKTQADKHWGDEAKYSSIKQIVKYFKAYQSRAVINLEQGWVEVETLSSVSELGKIIELTLLAPASASHFDLFSDATPLATGEPFLFEQVNDHQGQTIRWPWRAQQYAKHLLDTELQQRQHNRGYILSVRFPLVAQHEQIRAQRYQTLIAKYAQQYELDQSLIYGVMKTESGFNPLAVGSKGGLGLMQVVAKTAGRDVFEKVKIVTGQPSRDELLDGEQNIDIGAAYLHLLQRRYLSGISDARSLHYSTIAAYHGGAGLMFKAFHFERNLAPNVINSLSSAQVYERLIQGHPSLESRQYLENVDKAEQIFKQMQNAKANGQSVTVLN